MSTFAAQPFSATSLGPSRAAPRAVAPGRRNLTLDGLRGLLALNLLLDQSVYQRFDAVRSLPVSPGALSVWGFFVISAYVLCRAWDGQFVAFLARRLVRLWPLYALCLTLGYLLHGTAPELLRYAFLPVPLLATPSVEPLGWTISVEWWAMLAMPLLARIARAPAGVAMLLIALCIPAASWIDPRLIAAQLFILGAALSRVEIIRSPLLETRPLLWLGRIAYPLCLSHWLALTYLPAPLPVQLVAAVGVAHLLAVTVGDWSLIRSRQAAALVVTAHYRVRLLLERHQNRHVVGRLLLAALPPVRERRRQPLRERRGQQRVVDPQANVAGPAAGLVIPERRHSAARMQGAHGIGQPQPLYRAERRASLRANQGIAGR
jgi:peptidoglycan/LPS O-acetylase OafA/YrhL